MSDGTWLDDVQDAYTLLAISGMEHESIIIKLRKRFNLKEISVNPVGRVTSTVQPLTARPVSSTAMEVGGGAPIEPATPAPISAETPAKATESVTERMSNTAAGGVVVDRQGRVLLRKVANNYLGYAWSWPKGTVDADETFKEAALREVLEETGYEARIIGFLGNYKGTDSITKMYLMRPVKRVGYPDPAETDKVMWVDPDVAVRLLNKTTIAIGRARDLQILLDAAYMDERLSDWISDVERGVVAVTESQQTYYVFVQQRGARPKRWGRYRTVGQALDAAVAAQEDRDVPNSSIHFVVAGSDSDAKRRADDGDWDDVSVATADFDETVDNTVLRHLDDGPVSLADGNVRNGLLDDDKVSENDANVRNEALDDGAVSSANANVSNSAVDHGDVSGDDANVSSRRNTVLSPTGPLARVRTALGLDECGVPGIRALLLETAPDAVDAIAAKLESLGASAPDPYHHRSQREYFQTRQVLTALLLEGGVEPGDDLLFALVERIALPDAATDREADRRLGWPLGTVRNGRVQEAVLAAFIRGKRHRKGDIVDGVPVVSRADAGYRLHHRCRKTVYEVIAAGVADSPLDTILAQEFPE